MIEAIERAPTGEALKRAQAFQGLVPVLKTERLILRAPQVEDFQGHAEILEQPSALFMFSERPSRDRAWYDFSNLCASWMLHGHGAWAIEHDGEFAGIVHIACEPGDPEPEFGWMLRPAFEGRGIAFEAASAVRDHAFGEMGFATLISCVYPENIRSQRLATRLGAKRDPILEEGSEDFFYRHTKPEALV
ncbi:MAG: GNAT family N-acetyltransferase [Pseudomonadota bacterium]